MGKRYGEDKGGQHRVLESLSSANGGPGGGGGPGRVTSISGKTEKLSVFGIWVLGIGNRSVLRKLAVVVPPRS